MLSYDEKQMRPYSEIARTQGQCQEGSLHVPEVHQVLTMERMPSEAGLH